MAQRNARICKCKMKRRGQDGSDEDVSEDIFERNPHQKLTMSEGFTQPCKKSKLVVPDSDDSPASENENDEESVYEEDVIFPLLPIYQTDWKVVQR